MNVLGPWTQASPPPPGTRVRARYSGTDAGYTGTALGLQPVTPKRWRRHCRNCTCVFPLGQEWETLEGDDLPGCERWVQVELDPGQLELRPGVLNEADRGPRGGLILLAPAEGCTPVEEAHA